MSYFCHIFVIVLSYLERVMIDRRNVVKLFAILPFLGRAPVSFAAPAEVDREEALRIALGHVGVARRDVRNLKIERGEENGVPVYKVEFETAFGDFDVAVSRRSGDVVDADCEIREEWVRAARRPFRTRKRRYGGKPPGASPVRVRKTFGLAAQASVGRGF